MLTDVEMKSSVTILVTGKGFFFQSLYCILVFEKNTSSHIHSVVLELLAWTLSGQIEWNSECVMHVCFDLPISLLMKYIYFPSFFFFFLQLFSTYLACIAGKWDFKLIRDACNFFARFTIFTHTNQLVHHILSCCNTALQVKYLSVSVLECNHFAL